MRYFICNVTIEQQLLEFNGRTTTTKFVIDDESTTSSANAKMGVCGAHTSAVL